MMIDNDLKVHVLEVNGRPQLQSHVLDKAVNRPMLAEMLKIIGKVLLKKSCRETYDICLVLLKLPKCCACPLSILLISSKKIVTKSTRNSPNLNGPNQPKPVQTGPHWLKSQILIH